MPESIENIVKAVEKAAEKIEHETGGDIFEIPEKPVEASQAEDTSEKTLRQIRRKNIYRN